MSDAPGLTKYWTVPGVSLLLEEPQPKTFIPRWGLSFASEAVYKAAEVEARDAALRARVEAVERELEGHVWDYTPAMAEAKIGQLYQQIADLTARLAAGEQPKEGSTA